MAKNLYARKVQGQNSHKGILWIALVIALMLLVIPILWMHYPFRAGSFKKYRKTPLDKADVRIAVHGSIPKNLVEAQIPKKPEATEKTKSLVIARIEKPQPNPKGGGTGGETTSKPHIIPNPYEDKEKAQLAKKQQEERFKRTVSAEALKELETQKSSILPEEKAQNQATSSSSESTKKKGMYSLLTPPKQELKKRLSEPQILESTKSSSPAVKRKVGISERKSYRNVTFWIQVGAFSKKYNALDMIQRLKNLGYKPVLHQIPHAKYGKLYLVRIPTYGKKTDARKFALTVAKKLGEKTIIVSAGK